MGTIRSFFGDPWLLASALSQLALLILGVVVTLQEQWATRHKTLLVFTFSVFGIVALVTTLKQGADSARANADLTTSLSQLGKASIQIQHAGELNTKLQEKLLTQSTTITELSKENILAVTGGNSYAVIGAQTKIRE